MSQTTRGACELLPSTVCDLYATAPEPVGLAPRRAESPAGSGARTSLKQYILDPVLPMLTLLSMSVLTVVMLVVIVAAVADMDRRLPDSYVSVEPWTDVPFQPPETFAPEPGAYAGLVAPPAPEEDRESWPGPESTDPF
jgi:hypothetical protein